MKELIETKTAIRNKTFRQAKSLTVGVAPSGIPACGTKEFKLVNDLGGGKMVKNVPIA